jgi:glycosyltransferase involved in cell wall biosynthesis
MKKSSIAEIRPLVSIITPGFNEEAIVIENLGIICDYMKSLEKQFRWELIFINDGSIDKTGLLVEQFAKENPNVKVFHHTFNLNLGNALKTGFAKAIGDFTITLDIDLSYNVPHIKELLDTLVGTNADMVIASPFMKGGKVTAVPYFRLIMSKWVNRFMRIAAQEKFHTYTGMVRGYKTKFLKSLNLKTKDYEINPEIIYKAMILRARIIEIPAHLDWTEQNKVADKRASSIRVLRGFFSGIMSGFIFRPYIFFIGIGVLLMCLSMYELVRLFYDTLFAIPQLLKDLSYVENPFSYSLSIQFKKNPQTFLVGGLTFLASIQFLSLGFLSLQSKRYFEELFHFLTEIKKNEQIEY